MKIGSNPHGSLSSFTLFCKLKNYLQRRKLTWAIPQLGGKLPVPTQDTHGDTFEHQKIEGAAHAFGILSDSITARDYSQLFPTDALVRELDNDPEKLFEALLVRSKGVVPADAFADNLTAFMSITWVTTTQEGKSLDITGQSEETMAKLIVCVEKSVLLADENMKINEADVQSVFRLNTSHSQIRPARVGT
jgi:hypothetical protein